MKKYLFITLSLAFLFSCGKNDTSSAPSVTLKIGDKYQGGTIVYLLNPVNPGYDEKVQHGITAANEDAGTAVWSLCDDVPNGADGIEIGKGMQNTKDILADCPDQNIAAKLCDDYTITQNGTTYDDWYLPSRNELQKLYDNKALIGGFVNYEYWSSTEVSIGGASTIDFTDGITKTQVKTLQRYIRPVRSF